MTQLNLDNVKKIYFMGIGGTGMAAMAGLCQEAGFHVTGSDGPLYPPMSTMLQELAIPVHTPYSPQHLDSEQPDLVVIANVLSRGNVELEHALNLGLPATSFAQLLGECFLKQQLSVVVSGTHGKTTTTSLLAHLFDEFGLKPGFLIGGIAQNFGRSFRIGAGKIFVVEGDEYDTAYFDKGPKFLHYYPKLLLVNNLEFDHADIYPNLAAIQLQFGKLMTLVADRRSIVCNISSPGACEVVQQLGIARQITSVSTDPEIPADWILEDTRPIGTGWQITAKHNDLGTFTMETALVGRHNAANILHALAICYRLLELGSISLAPTQFLKQFQENLRRFKSVKRRLELLGDEGDIEIYDDFAHHPTAISEVLTAVRSSSPTRRLIAAFEPRNATGRRSVLEADFARSLQGADVVWLAPSPTDLRIPEADRMNTQRLAANIGSHAIAFSTHESLFIHAKEFLKSGDTLVFMSPGSFEGVHFRLVDVMRESSITRQAYE